MVSRSSTQSLINWIQSENGSAPMSLKLMFSDSRMLLMSYVNSLYSSHIVEAHGNFFLEDTRIQSRTFLTAVSGSFSCALISLPAISDMNS